LGRRFRLQSGLVGLLIGLGCLSILLRQVDLKQSWNALGQLNGWWLLFPLAVFLANLILRALRWDLIFPGSFRPGFWPCLTALGIGNMANFLLPGRAGDLARCVLIARGNTISESSRGLATLAVEKILDGMALVGMILLSMWSLRLPDWIADLLRVASLIFGGALLVLIVLRYRTRAFTNLICRILGWLHFSWLNKNVDSLMNSFSDGLAALTSPAQILGLLAITAVIWATEAALIWGLARALGLTITFNSAILGSAGLGLGLMIPAAPGGLGTYELFGTEVFKLTGLVASAALTLTVVIHAWVFLTNVIAGMCLLMMKGLSLSQLRRTAAQKPSKGSDIPASV
jgi:glycosyltransferase 2 family protein